MNCIFIFCTTNILRCFSRIMIQFELEKHKFLNKTMLLVHLWSFQVTHRVKQCSTCQRTNLWSLKVFFASRLPMWFLKVFRVEVTNVGFEDFYGSQWLRARLCCRKISDSIFWLFCFTPRWLGRCNALPKEGP